MKSWLSAAVMLLVDSHAWAQVSVPQQIPYEGILSTLDGGSSDGVHSVRFSIWSSQSGGTSPLWSDTLSVTVAEGFYSATLGTTSDDPLPTGLFDGTVRYLELSVDGDLLSPREPMSSVPYSILAGGVQGGAVDATRYALNGTTLVNPAGHVVVTYPTDGGVLSQSVNGIFCGASVATDGAIADAPSGTAGYRATKIICENTCSTPTAHMCSASEILVTANLGVALPTSANGFWYATGQAPSYYTGLWGVLDDCDGWTSNHAINDGSSLGMVWNSSVSRATPAWCDLLTPIACCD